MVLAISTVGFGWNESLPIRRTIAFPPPKEHDMSERFFSKLSKRRVVLFVLLLLIAALTLGGVVLVSGERPPLPEALDALESDDAVTVVLQPWLTFAPAKNTPDTGFIFYPGGRIDPRGYAPLLRAIAAEGYLAVVPEMPLNIAAFRLNIADHIISAHPEVQRWVIGGHSVGGAMAAQYTSMHSEQIAGLAIWASYPPGTANLSGLRIPVTSIYGSRETRVTDSSVAERKHLLPADTIYVRIDGGDHHQFGSYEIDPEERLATISRDAQQQQTIEATLSVLGSVSHTAGD